MEKPQIKKYFKEIYVKIFKTVSKRLLPWQRLNWHGFNQHIIVFRDN